MRKSVIKTWKKTIAESSSASSISCRAMDNTFWRILFKYIISILSSFSEDLSITWFTKFMTAIWIERWELTFNNEDILSERKIFLHSFNILQFSNKPRSSNVNDFWINISFVPSSLYLIELNIAETVVETEKYLSWESKWTSETVT